MAPGIRTGPIVGLVIILAAPGCEDRTIGPTPPSCSYALSVLSLSFGAAGGAGSVVVTTGAACAWTARADAGWISITSGSTGTGLGTVAFTVDPNATTTARTSLLTVADRSVAVAQEGSVPCTLEISPSSGAHGNAGGTGSITITTAAGCAWTARTAVSWITLAPGSTDGTGNATITYSVARNTDTTSRSANITVIDRNFAVTQSGDAAACQYAVSPVDFSPCMTSPSMAATVTTQSACTWTATATDAWIEIVTGQSGTGTAAIVFRVSDNWLAPRSGQVLVRWPTVTAGQNIRVAQAGCRYSVTPASVSVGAAGGAAAFDVYQQSDPYTCGGALQNACTWTAQSSVAWITVTSSMPRAGDDRVSYSVAPNTGPARTGTITVRDQAIRVSQGGG